MAISGYRALTLVLVCLGLAGSIAPQRYSVRANRYIESGLAQWLQTLAAFRLMTHPLTVCIKRMGTLGRSQ